MSNAISLLYNAADNAAVSASSELPTAPASNTQNEQRSRFWRSSIAGSASLEFSLRVANSITHVAIVDANISLNGTFRVQAWEDDFDGAELSVDVQNVAPWLHSDDMAVDIPYGLGNYGEGPFGAPSDLIKLNVRNVTIIPVSGGDTARFWRVTFEDSEAPYIQCSRVYISESYQTSLNMAYGWRASRIDKSVFRESLSGQRYSQKRNKQLVLDVSFEALRDSERPEALKIMEQFGNHRPFVFSIFPDDSSQGIATTLYGHFENASFINPNFDQNANSFRVVEEL